ncbi:MAG: glycosyltransferase family 2 protein [bacterium]|nr:glycosyltransferase family 2 protein [bacterium]
MSSLKKSDIKESYSIIIPTYNQGGNLRLLIKELLLQMTKEGEIIVVDDASIDETKQTIEGLPIKYHRLAKNQGPAKARNVGVSDAKGGILIFFDADVLPYPNTLKEVLNFFKAHPEADAVSGMWDKTQKEKNFFAEYKALRDWSYFFKEDSKKDFYYFTPRVAAIKKEIITKVGGFNTMYKKADMEDLEFGFRVEKITPVYFHPQFLVQHQFKGALTQIKNYFKRTYYFLCLFVTHRKFCRTVSTPKEAFAVFLAAFTVFSLVLGFLQPGFFFLLPVILVLYLYQEKEFLFFFYEQKGFFFTFGSFLFNFLLHLAIFTAVIAFFLTLPFMFWKKEWR